jgi:hypothetical protein
MIVKVIKRFKDRHTAELHEVGDVLTVSAERFAEIESVGKFVMEISSGAATVEGDGFDEMTVAELREYADKTHKLTFKPGMKKAEIIAALREMEAKK